MIVWENPPKRRTVKTVDAGVVVLVRFWPSDPAAVLIEDVDGVPPHVVFRANLAPQGTTAFQHFVTDPASGTIVPVPGSIGERPLTNIDGLITPDGGNDGTHVDYDLDAGQAFLCPFSGEIQLIGGEFLVDAAPYNVSVQVVMPQEVSLEYAGPVKLATPMSRLLDEGLGEEDPAFLRRLHRETGWRPRKRPTMTYFNVNGTIPVPRGAVDVQVGATTTAVFNMSGSAALGKHTVTLTAGAPMPLGAFSIGTFTSDPLGVVLPWISFGVEVA